MLFHSSNIHSPPACAIPFTLQRAPAVAKFPSRRSSKTKYIIEQSATLPPPPPRLRLLRSRYLFNTSISFLSSNMTSSTFAFKAQDKILARWSRLRIQRGNDYPLPKQSESFHARCRNLLHRTVAGLSPAASSTKHSQSTLDFAGRLGGLSETFVLD